MTIDKIYKYVGLENDVKIVRAKEILKSRSIYCALASEFNDPFELDFSVSFSAPMDIKMAYFKKNYNDNYLDLVKLKDRDRDVYLKNLEDSVSVKKAKRDLREHFRICCFSYDYDNINQWTHYADGHQGICIEVSVIKNKGSILPILYTENLPSINFYNMSEKSIKESGLNFSKHKTFDKERECRIMQKKHSKYFNVGSLGEISTIYLGCRFDNVDFLAFIKKVLPTVPIKKLLKSEESFELLEESNF